MVMEAALMDDKSKRIDLEVSDIHSNIVRNNLILKVKMQDIQADLKEWELEKYNDENGDLFK